ncbi:MAG TPA: hypothetical protein VHC49_00990 [Mycobacteriales bacterium]|nr:hypothetical protein [Mycobacteriales bacterium]
MKADKKPELARIYSARHAAERGSARKRAVVLTPVAGVAVAGAIIGAMALVPGHSTDRAGADSMSGAMSPHMIRADHPQFAGRTITAYLTGYDKQQLRFRTAHWIPGGLDGGHFAVDKQAHAAHLADAPTIRSAVALCSGGKLTMDATSGAPTKSCSSSQLATGLSHGAGAYADLTVDATGRITTVSERYVP